MYYPVMLKLIQDNKNIIFIFSVLSILFIIRIIPFENPSIQLNDQQIALIPDNISNEVTIKYIFIEVVGAVVHPGVYLVTDNILVNEALNLAGGLDSKADKDHVDQFIPLSKKVYPEMKIYIPFVKERVGEDNGMFYINTCTKEQLIAVKGIGEVTATNILDNRPFYTWEDVEERTGIRQDALRELRTKAWL